MADLQQSIIGALQQAGLRDPQMLQQIAASVMQGLGSQPPSPQPGFGQPAGPAPMGPVGQAMGRQLVPGFSGPAPSEQYGYEGQPNRDLLASQSYGRGPAPASIDPTAESDLQAELAGEGGWSPFSPPPQMMPPGSPAMGPGVTAAPPSAGLLLSSDALRLRKPAPPSKGKSAGKRQAGPSESDRLNMAEVARIQARRGLLASGA